jgi:ribosome recycling factor
MKIAIETLIHEMESRLGGYVTLLVYRYANLCIKAQPMALLSAQIIDEEMGEMKIEEVAGVVILDEFHLELIPYDPRFNFPLCKAIKKEHPEFKQELVKPNNAGNEDERYLILTMPEVNKDRHDALIDSVNVLYDGCKAQIDKTSAAYRLKLEKKILTLSSDDERNEAKDALEKSINNHQGIIDKVKDDKVKEIDDAYQRYLDEQTAKRSEAAEKAAARGETAGKKYKMDNHE